jgi:hypothetical protein
MKVPKVDADGNELGGVPTCLRDAPSARTSAGTSRRRGSTPGRCATMSAARSRSRIRRAERLANGDPRLSLEERYGSHNAYVLAVKNAAGNAWSKATCSRRT